MLGRGKLGDLGGVGWVCGVVIFALHVSTWRYEEAWALARQGRIIIKQTAAFSVTTHRRLVPSRGTSRWARVRGSQDALLYVLYSVPKSLGSRVSQRLARLECWAWELLCDVDRVFSASW